MRKPSKNEIKTYTAIVLFGIVVSILLYQLANL